MFLGSNQRFELHLALTLRAEVNLFLEGLLGEQRSRDIDAAVTWWLARRLGGVTLRRWRRWRRDQGAELCGWGENSRVPHHMDPWRGNHGRKPAGFAGQRFTPSAHARQLGFQAHANDR